MAGTARPTHIEIPGPGQESVWDYPRPPRVQPSGRHIVVIHRGEVVADTTRAVRVLETSLPPSYYIPPEDVRPDLLRRADRLTFCEWKGTAVHDDVVVGDAVAGEAAWSYPNPSPGFEEIAGYLSFYPARVDEITVDGERVRAQEGGYYGGWITDELVGPIKGAPGTEDW